MPPASSLDGDSPEIQPDAVPQEAESTERRAEAEEGGETEEGDALGELRGLLQSQAPKPKKAVVVVEGQTGDDDDDATNQKRKIGQPGGGLGVATSTIPATPMNTVKGISWAAEDEARAARRGADDDELRRALDDGDVEFEGGDLPSPRRMPKTGLLALNLTDQLALHATGRYGPGLSDLDPGDALSPRKGPAHDSAAAGSAFSESEAQKNWGGAAPVAKAEASAPVATAATDAKPPATAGSHLVTSTAAAPAPAEGGSADVNATANKTGEVQRPQPVEPAGTGPAQPNQAPVSPAVRALGEIPPRDPAACSPRALRPLVASPRTNAAVAGPPPLSPRPYLANSSPARGYLNGGTGDSIPGFSLTPRSPAEHHRLPQSRVANMESDSSSVRQPLHSRLAIHNPSTFSSLSLSPRAPGSRERDVALPAPSSPGRIASRVLPRSIGTAPDEDTTATREALARRACTFWHVRADNSEATSDFVVNILDELAGVVADFAVSPHARGHCSADLLTRLDILKDFLASRSTYAIRAEGGLTQSPAVSTRGYVAGEGGPTPDKVTLESVLYRLLNSESCLVGSLRALVHRLIAIERHAEKLKWNWDVLFDDVTLPLPLLPMERCPCGSCAGDKSLYVRRLEDEMRALRVQAAVGLSDSAAAAEVMRLRDQRAEMSSELRRLREQVEVLSAVKTRETMVSRAETSSWKVEARELADERDRLRVRVAELEGQVTMWRGESVRRGSIGVSPGRYVDQTRRESILKAELERKQSQLDVMARRIQEQRCETALEVRKAKEDAVVARLDLIRAQEQAQTARRASQILRNEIRRASSRGVVLAVPPL